MHAAARLGKSSVRLPAKTLSHPNKEPATSGLSEERHKEVWACRYFYGGSKVEVDKGLLIENECALLGIGCVRPMKMVDGQKQQSADDAALTQKVGKSRIVIEQKNGQMKGGTDYFDKTIPVCQLGLADAIFRAGFLLQNFKVAFIQE